jgi:ABC-type multidrug transport system ATPase subunit
MTTLETSPVRLAEPGLPPAATVPAAIELCDLTRMFGRRGRRITAVRGLSLKVGAGQVFGLLGPNGSGKTTTINMISGLIPPTSGTVTILGMPVEARRTRRAVRQLVGTVPQETALYNELTAQANMAFHADLYRVPRPEKAERIAALLQLVGLADRAGSRVGTFSGGMKRRLAIARALLHDPEVIILDEPTLGVDVHARAAIWDYISGLRDRGKTILLTTNQLEEAQELCDELAIIDHGQLAASGTPAILRRSYGATIVSLHVQPIAAPRALDQALEELRQLGGVTNIAREPATEACHLLTVTTREHAEIADIIAVAGRWCVIADVAVRDSSLHEVFLRLTGRELRD